MNMIDIQNSQTTQAMSKVGGKDSGTGNGLGNFASLLQYLTSTSQPMVPLENAVESDTQGEDQQDGETLVKMLAMQPDQALLLLDDPRLEELKQDSKVAMQFIQFVKAIHKGESEEAVELLQQLPKGVEQAVTAVIASILGITKNISPSQHETPHITQDVVSAMKNELKTTNGPVSKDTLSKAASLLTTTVNDPSTRTHKGAVTQMDLMMKGFSDTKTVGSEPLKGITGQEGKEQPLPLPSLPLFKNNQVLNVRPTLLQGSNIDEQLAQRIEAALKQAPFLKGADGSTRMSIRLYPEQLGEVVVQLDRKAGVLTVKLFAGTEQAKQMIDQQLGKLQSSLQHQAPLLKIETGMLASSVKEFDSGGTQQERQQTPQEEQRTSQEEEVEEEEDDGLN